MLRKPLLPLLGISTLCAFADQASTERLKASTEVLTEMIEAKGPGIPTDMLQKAYCAVVIPNVKKVGFVWGGKYGRGFASCRRAGGGWSAPAALRVDGVGYGLEFGASETDVVIMVMTQKGMQGMLANKFTLRGEATAHADARVPLGRDVTADTVSYSRSKGVFGGLSLQGGTFRPDVDVNKQIYGKKQRNNDILTGKVDPTPTAADFLSALAKYGGTDQVK